MNMKILDQESLSKIVILRISIGIGLNIIAMQNKPSIGSGIGKGGNSVHMSGRAWAVPEKKIGMVCFTNSNEMDWGDLVDDIMVILAKN